MKNIVDRTLVVKRNTIKRGLFLVLGCSLASAVWAADPTLAINTTSQGTADFLQEYAPEGITLSSTASFSSGAVQLGNTPSSYDQHYFQVAATSKIDSVSFLISGNGSNKSIQAPVFGWAAAPNSNTADTYRILDAVTVTANSYAAAQWFTYNFSSSDVKYLRLYRSTKSISSTNPAYTGSSTALGSGQTVKVYGIKVWLAPTGPSHDATLKSLTYDGTSVPGFAADKTDYEVELPAGTTVVPTVAAVTTDSKAKTPVITQASSLPGMATVVSTAEDGETSITYTVTFTVASSAPKVTGATWDNIKGTATINQVTKTITGQVKNGNSLTLQPNFTGDNIASWTPQGAVDFSMGQQEYVFSSSTSESTTYFVSITEADPVSDDATLQWLKYNDTDVPGFTPSQLIYNVEIEGTTAPTVTAKANNANAKPLAITQAASVPGVAKVVVTAEDGETTLTYTINFTVAVPSTTLTIHVPEIYEKKTIAGGYGGTLSVYDGREYEVYYATYDNDSHLQVAATPGQKVAGITTTTSNNYSCKANDGWFEMTSSTSKSDFKDRENSDLDEFKKGLWAIHKLYNDNSYKLHIQGFDQFSFYGKDNSTTIEAEGSSKNKRFRVYIDGVMQPENKVSDSGTIRRYDISTGEHLIEVKGIGGSNNEFYGFSLRVAQEPRTKWMKGNDSTQTVLSTTSPKPIYYFTKYGNISGAETRLEWVGEEATGLELIKQASGALGDTLMLGGTANCAPGTYSYKVASYYNGAKTTEVAGKINVIDFIKAMTDTVVDAYIGEEMDEIKFRLYSAGAHNWQCINDLPNGINYNVANGIITFSGTPTTEGVYSFSVCALYGNCVQCAIRISTIDYGADPVLYLYKNNLAYEHDGVYNYLKNTDGRNLIARKAKDGLRPTTQYANYKWILISEDVDADNPEVLAAARGEISLPVLNMKSFSYSPDRLGWGEPNNGSLTDNGRSITVQRADHPIFQELGWTRGAKKEILTAIDKKGLMPAAVDYEGTICLATALTRDIDDYNGDGVEETFIHEVPADLRSNGKKYICMPIAKSSSENLSADGKKLVAAVVKYLLGSQSTVALPQLEITSFKINNLVGEIDDLNSTITISYDIAQYPTIDLEAVTPAVTVKDALTHTNPASGETVDFSKSTFKPVVYVVTDYINRREYNVSVSAYNSEGIDEVYTLGEWVNIYDIHGRKVATTNENIYQMELPRGVYMVVTENGNTLKLLK